MAKNRFIAGFIGLLFILSVVLPSLVSGATWNSTFTSGLISYWGFNEGTGSNLEDKINSNNGTAYNTPTWINGKFGQGLVFNGFNQYANVTQAEVFNVSSITITSWVRINNSQDFNYAMIMSKDDLTNRQWALGMNNASYAGEWYSQINNGGAGMFAHGGSTGSSGWQFVAMTRNTTGVYVFQNGTLVGSNTAGANMTNTSTNIQIAKYGTDFLNASLDEIAIWNRALDDSELLSLYDGGTGTFYGLNVNLNYPANNYVTLPANINFNCSASETSLLNLTLIIDGADNYTLVNTTANQATMDLTRSLSFTSYTNHTWNCRASSSSMLTGLNGLARNFNITNFIYNSQIYTSPVFENSNESFSANITYDTSGFTLGNSYLVYNGTIYLASSSASGSNVILNRSIIIPSVTSTGTLRNFYWNVGLVNSTGTFYFNTSTTQQTVNKGSNLTSGTSCGAGFSPALNFTFNYEVNRTAVNASVVSYYVTYGLAGNTSASVLNNSLTNVPSFVICINNSQTYYDIGYGEVQYKVNGMTDRRYYVFGNTRLTNTTVNIPLYSLDTTLSTSFLITAQSTSLTPYTNYYVGLLRWYPEINEYKVVELGKTDSQGQTVLRLKTEDVDYRLALYQSDGTLVKLLSPIRFVCQTNPCIYSIFVDVNPLDLTTFTGIETSLTWNSTLSRFTFIWNDPSQTAQTMNLTIWKDSGSTSDVICTASASGYTGVIICDVVGETGNLRAEAFRTASPSTIIAQLLISIRETFISAGGGAIGLFFGALLMIFLALAGSFNPIVSIIVGIIALIPLLLMGNITLGAFALVGIIGGVIWFIISKG